MKPCYVHRLTLPLSSSKNTPHLNSSCLPVFLSQQGGNYPIIPESSGRNDALQLKTVYDKLEVHRMVGEPAYTQPADQV